MGAPRAPAARWLRLLLGLCAWALRARACPRLCSCPGPGAVHCTFRYFTAVPARIPAGARRINLGYNSLLQLTDTDFSGLEKLELLMLHSNEISSIPDKAFCDLHSLQVLKMSYNKVRVLQQDVFYGLKSLARLHMDHNRIEFVHPNVFYGLTSLKLVQLEGNLLKQLHPNTFITLRYIGIFKVSSIKQIYLSDNLLTSLPQEMFSHLSELESIYLHGNPWSCDCNLHGFAEWAQERPDVIKCKKDRSSSGAQQCPACANPQNCTGKNLVEIPAASLVCTRPAIHRSLKLKNIPVPDDGDFSSLSPKDFIAPIGSMVLNMTDQAGNQGNLVCNIQKPKEMSPISFDKDGNNTVLKVSFSALLVCDISYENIQQLWSILALYSTSPLELERTILPTKTPSTSYKYKQIYSEKNELFTNIETELRAEPSWLMQNKVALQLDRTATTLNTLHIQYFTDARIILPSVDENQVRNSWTIISKDNKTQTQHTVLVGGTVELECRAIGEPAPAIEWILADGSKVRAPYISEDGRIIVLETGTFTLRTADSFDTGLYHCIGTNYADADILTFRITVVDPYEEHTQVNGAQLSTLTGSALSLPCPSTAVPDASISWVLPGHVILHHSVRNKHIFENGTLKIQSVTKQDSGYFRCVAANQYGVDLLVFQVHVRMDEARLQEKHAAGGEGEAEEGSGNVMLAPVTRRKNSLASLATLTAPQESATSAPGEQTLRSASRRKSFGKMTYRRHRDRASSRFRGHRRQFASSARRADPQRWAALLEKTKRNSTLTEEQTVVATSLPIQALKSSNVSEDEEETSGEPTPPELESMILAAKIPSVSPLGKAMENMATADLPGAAGSAPARNTSAGVADAVTPPAPPFSHSVSPDTRRPQTYLKPTVTSPKSHERSDLSQIPANGMDQSTVSYGAGRTSMVFNAAHRLVSSEENNSQYLKFVSVTPMASAAATTKHITPTKPAEKLLVFAEAIDKTLTSTDPQVSAVTGSEPVTESGYIYFHSTQKPLTPKLLGSANITQQQVQLFGDVTTHAPQARQQHGRRRKISVRRRIVRPDRIPALSEHRYNLGSPGSARGRAAAVPGAQPTTNHISNSLGVNNIDSSPNPHSPEAPLSPSFTTNGQLERSAGAHGNTALLLEEKNELTARQAAASAVAPFTAEDTWADSQWKSEASSQANTASTQPIALEAPPTLHTPHVAAETTHTASNEVLPTFDPISPNGKLRMSPKNYQIEKTTWEGASGNATDKAVSKKLPQTHTEVLPSPAASAAHPAPTAALPTADASPLAVVPVSHEDPHAAALLSPDQDAPGSRGTSGEHSPATGLPPRASPASSVLGAASSEPSAAPAAARPAGGMPRAGRRRGQRRRRPQQGPAAPRAAAGARSAALAPASAMPTSTGPCSAQAEGASPASQPPPATAAAGRAPPPGTDALVTQPVSLGSTTTPVPGAHATLPTTTATAHAPAPEPPATGTAGGSALSSASTTGTGGGTTPSSASTPGTTAPPALATRTAESTTPSSTSTTGTAESTTPSSASTTGTGGGTTLSSASTPGTTASPALATRTGGDTTGIGGGTALSSASTTGTAGGTTPSSASMPGTTASPVLMAGTGGGTTGTAEGTAQSSASTTRTGGSTTLSSDGTTEMAGGTALSSASTTGTGGSTTPSSASTPGTTASPALVTGTGGGTTGTAEGTAQSSASTTGTGRGTARSSTSTTEMAGGTAGMAGGTTLSSASTIGPGGGTTAWAEGTAGMAGGTTPSSASTTGTEGGITGTAGGSAPSSAGTLGTAVLHTLVWARDEDSAVTGSSETRQDGAAATSNPPASGSSYPRQSAKPRIIGGKQAAFTVLASSDAFLPCEATGDPLPTIQWTKLSPEPEALDGPRERRLQVLPNGTLAIAAARVRDGGQYLCVAANRHGAARLLVTLAVVAYPPRVRQGRARVLTAHSGGPVALSCSAEGRPAPTFSWILANKTHVSGSSTGNSRVSVQPDGTLVIREVTVYDRGLYTCVASNPAGTDTLVVKLQVVAAPPVILEERREHVEAVMGENLKLPCTAQGNPQPSVHWVLSDGTAVKPLQLVKGKLFLFPNGTLHVRSVAAADSGTYECIATSSTGSERRVVRLGVLRRETLPRIASASQGTTRLNFGDLLLLNCTATGEPEPTIIWRLPSRAVVDRWHRMGSRIHVFPNGSLVIQAVTEKDAGDYLCVARNQIGDDLILMKVIITMKPAKIDQKQYFKKLVPYGKDFRVDCKASGLPAPEISWSLPDGTTINSVMPVQGGGRRARRYVLFDNGTLYLNQVGLAEEGDYTCRAQNTLGRDEMKIHITVVTAAPRIKHSYKTYTQVKAGDTALLDCEVVGEPRPKIFWLLPSGDMISSSGDRYLLHANGSLSVSRVKLSDAGEYMCVARNPGGDDTKLYKVDVASTPPTINGLFANKTIMKVTAVRHAKKQIDCRAEGTPTPQIMWVMPDNIFLTAPYHGSRITVHKNGTLEIRNLRPSDTGDFTCVARNDGGESTLLVQLQVLEMLRRPMFKNPFNEKVIANPGKTNVLNCSVDGNPPPEISWMLPNGTWFSGGIRSARFLTGDTGTLAIYNTGSEDAGKYRCAARNKVGYIEKLIILELGQRPSILVHTKGPVKGIAGEPLSLHCLSQGSPKPSTAWTVPSGLVLDRPRVSSKYVLLENGTLLVRAATAHDHGTYVCTARNTAGEASVRVAVAVVAYAPRITSGPPRSVRTAPGAPLQLTCAALGAPRPQIVWELPDRSVLSAGDLGRPSGRELLHPQGTLVIPNPRPSDSGAYKCTAKNHLGSDSTVTYVHVI